MAGTGKAHLQGESLVRVEDLVVEFPAGKGQVTHAVSGISFEIRRNETLGVVGESGSGKTTTGRALLQLPRPTSGSIVYDDQELTGLSKRNLRSTRRHMQVIFQDSISSLNPRRSVRDSVAEPLRVWKVPGDHNAIVAEAFAAVGLDVEAVGDRRPHEFSGGQCQRINIARCLVLRPSLIVCDEPVSALDVSVQAQIINLLEDLKEQFGLTLLFVSHDLSVVNLVSDRVMVMYLGKICEIAPTRSLFSSPWHPYSKLLLASMPRSRQASLDASETVSAGVDQSMPSSTNPPSGCRFRTRCSLATEQCAREEPQLREVNAGHFVACHHF